MQNQVSIANMKISDGNLPMQSVSKQFADVAQGRKNPLWKGLPDRLRRTLKRAGLSQRQAARLSSCSDMVLRHINAGGQTSIDVVEKLAAGLGVPALWLAFGPEAGLPFRQVQKLPKDALIDPEPQPGKGIFRERYKGAGERVRQVREDNGLTLLKVGTAAQMSDQAVLNTEAGATVPKLETIEAIAVALDVAPGWLAYGDEEEGS